MVPKRNPEGMGKLVELFTSLVAKGGELPSFLRDQLSLVAEKPSAIAAAAVSAHESGVFESAADLVPMHANVVGGIIVVGVDPLTMEVVGTSLDSRRLEARLRQEIDVPLDVVQELGPDPLDVDTWGENLIGFDLSRRG
ncbi:MAG: hypothetical protein MR654_06795 [Corynebacterium glucuronolyticum]|nr:hypothetical protein [Corynebacterium glucuronolyticum]